MAQKSNKGKGVASSSQGTKRASMGQEAQNKDASMPKTTLVIWTPLGHSARRRPINVEVVIRDVLRRARVKKRVGPEFEEPFDDNDATDNEQDRVDFDLKSDGDDGEDIEMGEASYAPTNDED
ncbi:hypothetical protein HAX54_051365 [Datura stramonium]|uniref:Uncharacterized protein n=1 Tax=Datura stramonium TaxID=4076 RepID=A0ABS8WMA9_DATST|nr:hypothetical protein [Datura stramonium]